MKSDHKYIEDGYIPHICQFWYTTAPGGRSWQPFGEGKNAHTNFRQACICYFHDKYVVFVRNFNFANLIQCNMQHTPYNDSLLAQETLLLSPKGTLLHQVFQKVRKSRQILIIGQNSACRCFKFSSKSKLFCKGLSCLRTSSATLLHNALLAKQVYSGFEPMICVPLDT